MTLLAKWFVTLPWAPLQGPAELLALIPEPGSAIGAVVSGAVVGLGGAFFLRWDSPVVRVRPERVGFTHRGRSEEVARTDIGLVFGDAEDLVLTDRREGELLRERCDLNRHDLAAAFRRHGYDWAFHDPHENEYRRWIPDAAELPEGTNALLKAREKALKGKVRGNEARELRHGLARIGVIVRDTDERQYWRTARGSDGAQGAGRRVGSPTGTSHDRRRGRDTGTA